jgi:hypothetical protein
LWQGRRVVVRLGADGRPVASTESTEQHHSSLGRTA